MSRVRTIRADRATPGAPAALLRPATPADAPALADLVVMASEGLCLDPWAAMAGPGETPLDVGRRRAARDEGAFSWRHATVAEVGGQVAAALLGYPLPATPEPIGPDLRPEFVPLQELENEACGSWYVNVLAAVAAHRGQGLGTRLLAEADRLARASSARGLSLIVASTNEGAIRLYRRQGFEPRAVRPAADPAHTGSDWLLLARAA